MKRILLLMCMLSLPALADPVTWYIDVSMDDGGTLTGSFVFDDATDEWSELLLSYEGDTTFTFPLYGGETYLGAVEVDIADLTGSLYLFLSIPSLLTDAGGSFNFDDYISLYMTISTCYNPYCSYAANTVESVSGVITSINTASVPEPGTMALLATGLAGLGFIRRRKSNQRTNIRI